jgi:hypothetical protein
MPRVLRKLRVDEISCVDRAANGGAKIMLFKRDDRDDTMHKATYRGDVQGHWLRNIQNLTRPEVKHFLLHDSAGRALRRDFPNIPFDELVDHVCEASTRQKREAPKMDNMHSFTSTSGPSMSGRISLRK